MSGTLVPPHSSSRRAALLEQLVVALTSTETDALPIRTRAPDDPTIALLDAWATVGDVLGFYLDRIADEGYLTTATQPGSILALASLVGHQPTPGLAAQVYLAYALAPDPADGAVQFSSGLLFQSVPGPGQQPQTFESAAALVARPSWNLLAPKSAQPLQASTTSLVVDSTTARLSPNDVILLEVAGPSGAEASSPHRVIVASATVDYSAKVTNVTLQAPAVTLHAAAAAPPTSPQPRERDGRDRRSADGGDLGKPATPVPESANQLPQTAKSVFKPALGRRAAAHLDAAARRRLDAVRSARHDGGRLTAGDGRFCDAGHGGSVRRRGSAPAGVQRPSASLAGTRDWPIGDTFTLQLSVTAADFLRLLQMAVGGAAEADPDWLRRWVDRHREATDYPVIDVQCSVATFTSQATIDVSGLPATASPALQGFGEVHCRAAGPAP